MARREPLHPTVLTIRVTFEPHRGAQDCVAQAYEHIVPRPRRPIVNTPPAISPEATGHTQPAGRRNAS
jgi:hypothetical protein